MTENVSQAKKPSFDQIYAYIFCAIICLLTVVIGGISLVLNTSDAFHTKYYTHERINTAFSSIDLSPSDGGVFLAGYLTNRNWIITSMDEHAFTYFKDGDFHTLDINNHNLSASMQGRYIIGVMDQHCPDKVSAKRIDQLGLHHAGDVTHLSVDDITYCYYDQRNITAYSHQKLASLWGGLQFDITIASIKMHNNIRQIEDFRHGTNPVPNDETSSVDG